MLHNIPEPLVTLRTILLLSMGSLFQNGKSRKETISRSYATPNPPFILNSPTRNSAVDMSEEKNSSGSERLDDDERSLKGGPDASALQAVALTEISQQDIHLTDENIVDFDGDDDPANPLNCEPRNTLQATFDTL